MHALATALTARGVTCELADASAPTMGPIVVVDSYRQRADDRAHFTADLLVSVEDLDRDQAVDIAVDPSPGAARCRHRRAGLVLAGPSYALIDPQIALLERRPVGPGVRRVLVTGGGADNTGWAIGVARALRAELMPSTAVAVARMSSSPGDASEGVETIWTADGLGSALADADLVVTAAGVTMLEALALGRPTVAAALFENQQRQARAAAAAGAIVLADLADAAVAAIALAADSARRVALASRAGSLVDGAGSDRVARAICERR